MAKHTDKLMSLNNTPFVDGQPSQPIAFQPAYACRKVNFTVSGTITLANKAGTILAQMATASDGSVLWPYLLNYMGSLTFNGTCSKGKGLKVQNVPISLLWLEQYLENKGVGPYVNDGGMQAANFANGTYNVEVHFSFNFYDPMLPPSQRGAFFYRPNRYQKQPTWTITGGNFFKGTNGNYTASLDTVATTGDTVTSSTLTVTSALTITATAVMVPAFKYSADDVCFDRNFEYSLQPNVLAGNTNGQVLQDLGLQMYIMMICTTLSAANGEGTNKVETGSNLFGTANAGLIAENAGSTQISRPNAIDLKGLDVDEFIAGPAVLPMGLLIIDGYGHNTDNWPEKTFLALNAPAHTVDAQITPAASGSNYRLYHVTGQPSQAAINLIGQNKFPAYKAA